MFQEIIQDKTSILLWIYRRGFRGSVEGDIDSGAEDWGI